MSDEIDSAVRQWLAKAEVDWTTVEILSEHARGPHQAVCFHCQQYVEKLLKALLTRHEIEAPRTHDLRRLIQLAGPIAPGVEVLADRADALSLAAVEIRYPDDGREVTAEEMREMMQLGEQFAAVLLPLLR
jgi:HEPN domain-containing protein